MPDASTHYYDEVPAIMRVDKADGGLAIVTPLWEVYSLEDLQVDDAYVYVVANDSYGREFIARFAKAP